MKNTDRQLNVRFRGSAEPLATELWAGLRGVGDFDHGPGPIRLDRGGAVLGAGTVIVTIIATTLVQEVVKQSVDWLAKWLEKRWSTPDSNPEVSVHVRIEIGDETSACRVDPQDDSAVVVEKISVWQETVAKQLAGRI